MSNLAASFTPDWVSPPGDTILDLLEERDWSQADLASRAGYSSKHINQLINGKVPLSDDIALALERVFGTPMRFWLAREAKYREHKARLEAAKNHESWVAWLDTLPVKELMDNGWIPKERITAKAKPSLVEACLRFFGVASPDEWRTEYGSMQAAFRRSREEQCDTAAIVAWLRKGEQSAETLSLPKYDKRTFVEALPEIRKLTVHDPSVFEPKLKKLLGDAGVALVFVPAIKRAYVSGVARWLNPHRPLIQLSLFGKTNDRFWFNLAHECAHILLHATEKKSVYLDDLASANIHSKEEDEANGWARDFLIPPDYVSQLQSLQTKAAVIKFSNAIGLHPGIVVGRLQHDGIIDRSWMNDLKARFRLIETAAGD